MKLDTVKESSTIKAEAYFNKEHTHRYLWRRVWDKDKPLACVITLNPCMADTIVTDTTTYLIVNNVANLERFGGVEIVNLFSMLTKKLNFRWNSTEEMTDETNDGFIQKSANDCESVIIAWGKCAETNMHINERAIEVINLLEEFHDKMYLLDDGEKVGCHPLFPGLRKSWNLVKFTDVPTTHTDADAEIPTEA